MKAAIYCRVSSEMQAEETLPIQGQLEECTVFAKSKGWEIVKVYKDEGFTGRTTDRPGYLQMMADARRKPRLFEKVIAWKGSRIARNIEDRMATEAMLGRNGISISFVKEPEVEGTARLLVIPMMAAIDEYLSGQIAEDTKRGGMALARLGYSTGGKPPRGYRVAREVAGIKRNGQPLFRTKWEVDPEWRDKVVEAFKLVASGASTEEIIATGVIKCKSHVTAFFRNPTFIGERAYNRIRRDFKTRHITKFGLTDPGVIRTPNAHEAIIPLPLWDRVQQVLDKRRPQPGQARVHKDDFILSGLLWCVKHDCPLTGHANTQHNAKTGEVKRWEYYACETLRRGGRKASDCPLLRKEALEKFVMDVFKDKVFTRGNISKALTYLAETAKGESERANTEALSIKGRIFTTKREIERLTKALAESDVKPQSVFKAISDREKEIVTLEKQLESLTTDKPSWSVMTVDDSLINTTRKQVLSVLDTAEPQQLKVLLRSYIERIKISGGSVSLKFNFQKPPDSCQELVAGVGFEPTTFGL